MSREPFTEGELAAIEDLVNRQGDDPVDEYARLLIADLRAARAELAELRQENEIWKTTNRNLSALVDRREARLGDMEGERNLARDELAVARVEIADLRRGNAWFSDQRDELQAALTVAHPATSDLEIRNAELYAGRGMARRMAMREQKRAHLAERRLAAVITACQRAEHFNRGTHAGLLDEVLAAATASHPDLEPEVDS